MVEHDPTTFVGDITSPNGLVFGVQGWTWGEQRPVSITFFLDSTCVVSDQHGRPIKGVVHEGKPTRFATAPPQVDVPNRFADCANHAQTIAALEQERIDWRRLNTAGWPQLPYSQLKELPNLPFTPVEELRKIKDVSLRKDALRMRREMEEARAREEEALIEDE